MEAERYVLTNGQTYFKSCKKNQVKKTNDFEEVRIFDSIEEVIPIKNKYESNLIGYKVSFYSEEKKKWLEKEYKRAKINNMCVLKNNDSFYISDGKSKTKKVIEAARFSNRELAEEYRKKHPGKTKGYDIFTISEVENAEKEKLETKKTIRRTIDPEERKIIYQKSKGHCYICGEFVDFDSFQVEHKVPLSKGGTNEMENLYCSCEFCNQLKQSYLFEDFIKKINKIFINQLKKKHGFLPYVMVYFLSKVIEKEN